jgi:hypothetical protein
MPNVCVAVPEPEVIAEGPVVAVDMPAVPVAVVAGSPVAERSLEAADPTTAVRTGAAMVVAELAEVAGAAIESAMTCARGLMGPRRFDGRVSTGSAVVEEEAVASPVLSKLPLLGR